MNTVIAKQLVPIRLKKSNIIRHDAKTLQRFLSSSQICFDKDTELRVKWYYATDFPESKPAWYNYKKESEPEKFVPFSEFDSNRLEKGYQKLVSSAHDGNNCPEVRVKDDKLFSVNLKQMLISPVFWEGAKFSVRRGIWFNSDGVPLPAELTNEIESGFQSLKDSLFSNTKKPKTVSKPSHKEIYEFNHKSSKLEDDSNTEVVAEEKENDIKNLSNDRRVLYFDDKNAVIFPGSRKSAFELGVIRNFGMGSVPLFGVEQIRRGYSDSFQETMFDNFKPSQFPALSDYVSTDLSVLPFRKGKNKSEENTASTNSMNGTGESEDSGSSSSKKDKMQETMSTDFQINVTENDSERPIKDLVLCIHGIGQILGPRYESVDFIHSINVLRNTMRTVYNKSELFRKKPVNSKSDNNFTQVLPICWRHAVGFHPYEELNNDKSSSNEARLPALVDLNINGVRALRELLGDVVLDILLYYEPRYRKSIISSVTKELNRVFSKYKELNPDFNGNVHILGHSLGSAIAFDILSAQKEHYSTLSDHEEALVFNVDSLFCIGSPVGVFNLLKKKNIISRADLEAPFSPQESDTFQSPKCANVYNIFHSCDLVSYRMEPLVNKAYAKLAPKTIPFAFEGINSQIKGWAEIGDGIQSKITAASGWFQASKKDKNESDNNKTDEPPLSDLLKSLINDAEQSSKERNAQNEIKESLIALSKLNRNSRLDYMLPTGVFDISLLSVISAHVSYFEDADTAAFILKELRKKK